jgi:hypothetical protein
MFIAGFLASRFLGDNPSKPTEGHHAGTGPNGPPSELDNMWDRKLAGLFLSLYNPARSKATVAQLVEQTIRNRPVKGSNPFGGSTNVASIPR